jgi:phosphatidylethanolamine/phosphatidyl-N-methylethanolamine N-methyltransferase
MTSHLPTRYPRSEAEIRPMGDILPFFLSWLANPLRVAAIIPSSRSLADVITVEISPATSPVIELGPGTGVFTRALLERGVPERQLALIEYGSDFARVLQFRFPQATVVSMDAAGLPSVRLFGGAPAGAVVSGLPLLTMPPRKIIAVLSGAFGHLRAGGAFYQFTYSPRCPVPRPILDRLGLRAKRIGGAFANVPPAAVYKLTRRRPVHLDPPEVGIAGATETVRIEGTRARLTLAQLAVPRGDLRVSRSESVTNPFLTRPALNSSELIETTARRRGTLKPEFVSRGAEFAWICDAAGLHVQISMLA